MWNKTCFPTGRVEIIKKYTNCHLLVRKNFTARVITQPSLLHTVSLCQ